MATNLDIDTNLLDKALVTGKLKSKRETVNQALREFIERREQLKILGLFNTVVYEETYDYKASRSK